MNSGRGAIGIIARDLFGPGEIAGFLPRRETLRLRSGQALGFPVTQVLSVASLGWPEIS